MAKVPVADRKGPPLTPLPVGAFAVVFESGYGAEPGRVGDALKPPLPVLKEDIRLAVPAPPVGTRVVAFVTG